MANTTNGNFDTFQALIHESIGPSWVVNNKDFENNCGSSDRSYPLFENLTQPDDAEQVMADLASPINNNHTPTHAPLHVGLDQTFNIVVSIAFSIKTSNVFFLF